jgi:hypothetical protein
MMDVTDRYRNDTSFRTLVDSLYSVITNAQYSPTEIREAAMLAHILYEERHIRPIITENIGSILSSR